MFISIHYTGCLFLRDNANEAMTRQKLTVINVESKQWKAKVWVITNCFNCMDIACDHLNVMYRVSDCYYMSREC